MYSRATLKPANSVAVCAVTKEFKTKSVEGRPTGYIEFFAGRSLDSFLDHVCRDSMNGAPHPLFYYTAGGSESAAKLQFASQLHVPTLAHISASGMPKMFMMHVQRSFIHPNGDWCARNKLILVNSVAFACFILFSLQAAKPDLDSVGVF